MHPWSDNKLSPLSSVAHAPLYKDRIPFSMYSCFAQSRGPLYFLSPPELCWTCTVAKSHSMLSTNPVHSCLCPTRWYMSYTLFSNFTSQVIKTTEPMSKLNIVTIQLTKSGIWDTIDDWYINNLTKNQVSAVFHSRVICRSVSLNFIKLCTETPCLCPWEGHIHGGRKETETSVTEFCYWNEKVLL